MNSVDHENEIGERVVEERKGTTFAITEEVQRTVIPTGIR